MTTPSIRVRTPLGFSGRGDIAEVWREDKKLGLLYQWYVHGDGVQWEGDALKYRLDETGGGEVEFRFLLTAPGIVLNMVAFGHLASEVTADGELHKQAVKLKGTRLAVA